MEGRASRQLVHFPEQRAERQGLGVVGEREQLLNQLREPRQVVTRHPLSVEHRVHDGTVQAVAGTLFHAFHTRPILLLQHRRDDLPVLLELQLQQLQRLLHCHLRRRQHAVEKGRERKGVQRGLHLRQDADRHHLVQDREGEGAGGARVESAF